jgi:hypothetical protein
MAVAVIVATPENAAFQFITPLTEPIVPAVAGDTAYDIEVLPVAVALYVSSGAFWQSVVAPAVKVTGPVKGFTVTVRVPVVVPHTPTAVAVIVAVPENDASQLMSPVVPFMLPAVTGNTLYVIFVLFADVAV